MSEESKTAEGDYVMMGSDGAGPARGVKAIPGLGTTIDICLDQLLLLGCFEIRNLLLDLFPTCNGILEDSTASSQQDNRCQQERCSAKSNTGRDCVRVLRLDDSRWCRWWPR